jgi:hypothetical protein
MAAMHPGMAERLLVSTVRFAALGSLAQWQAFSSRLSSQ